MTASIPQLSALQDMIRQFIELYPNRGGSLVKHETGNWREVSRFYDLPDEEIVRAISSAQTLARAANWDIRTKFTVLNINAESNYHNQLSLWQLQNSLAQKGVHKIRVYQSSESGGWHIYIFWNDWVGSTRSASVISAILMGAGFELAPETLEVFPSREALRLPLQAGFSWLNESGRVIVRRSEISLEGALALYLDEVVKFANEASWLDSDHANEVARLFQQQRAILRVVKPQPPAPVAEEPVQPEAEEQEAAPSNLVAEEIADSQVSEENFTPELVVHDDTESTGSEEVEPEDFDAEDTLSPALVSQAPPLNFSTHAGASPEETVVAETLTQAAFAAEVAAEKTCSQQSAQGEITAHHAEALTSQSEDQDMNDLEFAAEGTVSPELIAERVWTPQLVAEEAWPIDLADHETSTADPSSEEAAAPTMIAAPAIIEVEQLTDIDESAVEPALAKKDFWAFEPAVTDSIPSANVDDDYPPVVEQVMQIRRASPNSVNQQLSLPLQNEQSSRTVPEVAEVTEAESEEPIDFSPSKIVSLPQRASGIVRELVESEIPEIAFDTEPESEVQSKLKSEDNSWAGTSKHTKANDDSSLLHGKQRFNNVVNSGPSDTPRRKRPARNTTKERPSPGFPPA